MWLFRLIRSVAMASIRLSSFTLHNNQNFEETKIDQHEKFWILLKNLVFSSYYLRFKSNDKNVIFVQEINSTLSTKKLKYKTNQTIHVNSKLSFHCFSIHTWENIKMINDYHMKHCFFHRNSSYSECVFYLIIIKCDDQRNFYRYLLKRIYLLNRVNSEYDIGLRVIFTQKNVRLTFYSINSHEPDLQIIFVCIHDLRPWKLLHWFFVSRTVGLL